MEEEEEDDVGGAGGGGGGGGGVANTLLPLSSFVKKANQQTGSAHKEWSLAVNKFGKGVDKVRCRLALLSLQNRGGSCGAPA